MSSASKGGSTSSSFHFVAGLGSGILSGVLLQPFDLLKTRVQQSGSTSLVATIRDIASGPHVVRAFWRGTLPSTLRTGFGSAIYFTSLNVLRERVARSTVLAPLVVNGTTGVPPSPSFSSSALPKLSNLANMTTGAVARAAAGFILMPMTVIKVRYESNLYAYKSIPGAAKDIMRTEGLRGFFAGFGATAIRDAPYAGLYVVFYEQFKRRWSRLQAATTNIGGDRTMKMTSAASVNFMSGAMAAGLATAITNPFDAIKTRVQLQPREYHNMWHAAAKMIQKDGMRSLFDGLGLRMGRKALSSALAWTVYEELIRRGQAVWQHEQSKEVKL